MLAKNYCLARKEVAVVMRKGITASINGLFLKSLLAKNDRGDAGVPSRFAFLISAKEIKSAVERNRLRRRTRAVVWSNRCSIRGNYKVAVVLRRNLIKLNPRELAQKILNLFEKAKLTL